jgi:rubrerythrin
VTKPLNPTEEELEAAGDLALKLVASAVAAHVCGEWRPVDANDPGGPYVCKACGAPMTETLTTTPCPRCGALLPMDKVLAHGECGYVKGSGP